MSIRLGINGFGRIGRLVYRLAVQQNSGSGNGGGKAARTGYGAQIEIHGVNDIVPADNLAYLLQYDSMHRGFDHKVKADGDVIVCDGMKTRCTSIKDPAQLPWKELQVDYVLESTGLFADYESSIKHIQAGAKRVIISAPTKSTDKVPTFAYKVNDQKYNPKADQIISNASCTTNCLAPIAKVINDNFGLEEGLMTTVHAVTATQPTQDGPSKKDWRGGRNAYQNIIPASTGAAKAVTLCLPELKGKLTGVSFRVPVADVSCIDLTFRTAKPTSLDAINAAMKKAAEGAMQGVLAYTDEEVVSSDFISDEHSAIFDAGAGIELNDRFFKVVAWYDNEMGYAARCMDILRLIAEKDGVR